MRNYIQPGKTIPFSNITSNPVASGELVIVGALIGVATGAVIAGEDGELTLEGVFELPKATADDIIAGELLYNDGGELTVDGDDSMELVGVATKAAGAGITTVYCKLGVHGLMGPAGT